MKDIDRRSLLKAGAWAAPVLAVAAAVPAAAASVTPLPALTVTLLSTQLSSGGYSLNLRDGKYFDSRAEPAAQRLQRDSIWQVRPVFVVKDAVTGSVVAGATVAFDPGVKTDGQGNYVLAMTAVPDPGLSGNITQSPTKRTFTGTTDSTGQITVRVATTTWSQQACTTEPAGTALVPTPGTFIVVASAAGYETTTVALPYLVYDGGTTVVC